jgi:ribosome maturation factor RimP
VGKAHSWTIYGKDKSMNRRELQDSVGEAVLPVLTAIGYDLIEVSLVVSHGRRTLRVFIDKPGGVNVDDCARASRAVSEVLDGGDLFRSRYFLEVSSPGAERRLKSRQDFERFTGRKARLKVRSAEKGIEVLEGVIREFKDDIVGFELENGTRIGVPFEEIAKANLSI